MKPACLGMILAACCLAQPPVATEKASVSGSVTSIAGEPLRRVTLRLSPLRGSPMEAPVSNLATESDSQGNFTFDEVAPGRYVLDAERTGYLHANYSNARGPVLMIDPGQKKADIVIKMNPQASSAEGLLMTKRVSSGRDRHRPLVVHGSRSTAANRGAGHVEYRKTDADGAFAIGGLFPGRYVVSVAAPASATLPVKLSSLQSRQEIYVTTYYPDATDQAATIPVELSAGAQVRGLEIRLQRVPVFKVSGKVVNAATGARLAPLISSISFA